MAEGSFWLPVEADPSAELGARRLLAYGANRSPDGLAGKLGSPAPLVVAMHGWLRDFDTVYSAHVSPYGAVPATLQHSPATEVSVHVLHLHDGQLEAIDSAEPNYRLVRLEGISLDLDDGSRLTAVDAYVSRHGCLVVDGAERAVAAVRARQRAYSGEPEEQILAAVRDRLSPGEDLEDFILDGLDDPELQRRRTEVLRAEARPLSWQSWRPLQP